MCTGMCPAAWSPGGGSGGRGGGHARGPRAAGGAAGGPLLARRLQKGGRSLSASAGPAPSADGATTPCTVKCISTLNRIDPQYFLQLHVRVSTEVRRATGRFHLPLGAMHTRCERQQMPAPGRVRVCRMQGVVEWWVRPAGVR